MRKSSPGSGGGTTHMVAPARPAASPGKASAGGPPFEGEVQILEGAATPHLSLYTDSDPTFIDFGVIAATDELFSGFQTSANGNIQIQIYSGLIKFRINNPGGTPVIEILYDTGTAKIGFLGAGAVARQTVTGSRGGNAALASLLTGLANLGLITDSST